MVLISWLTHGPVEPYNMGSFSADSPWKKPPFCNHIEIIAYKRAPVDNGNRIFSEMRIVGKKGGNKKMMGYYPVFLHNAQMYAE